jgi:hypothetical protein
MTNFAAFREGAEATRSGHGKTAFVFAGGGSFGSIQVGMLRALAAHGVTADMVVGSSVGIKEKERRDFEAALSLFFPCQGRPLVSVAGGLSARSS